MLIFTILFATVMAAGVIIVTWTSYSDSLWARNRRHKKLARRFHG